MCLPIARPPEQPRQAPRPPRQASAVPTAKISSCGWSCPATRLANAGGAQLISPRASHIEFLFV
jgi:hypothetical protein